MYAYLTFYWKDNNNNNKNNNIFDVILQLGSGENKIYAYLTPSFMEYSRARSFPSKRVFQKSWKRKKFLKDVFPKKWLLSYQTYLQKEKRRRK